MTPSFAALSREYATLWDTMEITRDEAQMAKTVDRIIAHRASYEEVERHTRVPWYVVGIMDMREGGGGARTHLHNGDSLSRPTRQVPVNRPPGAGPFTFCQSACDALRIKGYDKVTDWTIERMAYCFERFNGFGYRSKKMPSPYLWGGTNHQQPGKYIRDHVFSRAVMDPQHGCMPLLKIICERCAITIPSMHGATPVASEPSSASNSKAEPAGMSDTAKTGTAAGVLGGSVLLADPVGLTSTLVAVKGNAGQLLAGVSLTGLLVPVLILAAVLAVIWYARRQA